MWLSDADIDIWLVFYDEIDESLLAHLHGLLSEEERHRESRLRCADARKQYRVTRAILRTVLSRYAKVAPADWFFVPNQFGRPQIANPDHESRGVCFNISHTRGLIALGITNRRELGIDVENTVVRPPCIEVAERFFARLEVDELASLPQSRRPERFFEYWTFKESYIKARGQGLSIPLQRFSFQYPHERAVQISIQPDLGDDASRWCFWQFQPAPQYLLAVCAERRNGGSPKLTLRKTIPTVMTEVLDARVLKTSEFAVACGAGSIAIPTS